MFWALGYNTEKCWAVPPSTSLVRTDPQVKNPSSRKGFCMNHRYTLIGVKWNMGPPKAGSQKWQLMAHLKCQQHQGWIPGNLSSDTDTAFHKIIKEQRLAGPSSHFTAQPSLLRAAASSVFQSLLFRAVSSHSLSNSRDGDSTAFLGSLLSAQ